MKKLGILFLGSLLITALMLSPAYGQIFDHICLIDEDCIDNGALAIEELAQNCDCTCDPAVCVNDHIADPGVRDPLNIPIGTVIGNAFYPDQGTAAPLMTGELFDEALFMLDQAPQSWIDAGPTADGLANYMFAEAAGFGNNGEFLLDEIPNVTPMRTADLEAMIGMTCCAVVYDSDISINYNPLQANLQGANLGIIAFTLLAVGQPVDEVLPDITIRIEDWANCQNGTVATETSSWGLIKSRYP